MNLKLSFKKTRFLWNEGLRVLVFCFLLTSCFSQRSMVMNKPVLKINSTEVTTQDFAERLAQKLKGYDALHAKDEANLKRAKESTAESFIVEVIVRDYAKKNGLGIDAAELEAEIDKIRSRYPDDNAFRGALAEEHISLERWSRDLEFTLLQKKLVAHLLAKVPAVTDEELRAYYNENKEHFEQPARIQLRQIVVETEDNAKRILDELNSGDKLADLAKKFSVAPEGENGGLTGWIEKGTLEVFDKAFKMKVGARSKIVKSPYGYHIYEVVKKESEARLSFEQAKAKIRTLVMERREQVVYAKWLEEQIRQSAVFRNDALIDSIEVTTRGT